jgi:polyisoprenoid-binding protein YceI
MSRSDWTIDTSHSTITFTARHMMIAKVRGTFGEWSGTMTLDDEDPTTARVDVHIQAAGIDTKEPQRDAHLRCG